MHRYVCTPEQGSVRGQGWVCECVHVPLQLCTRVCAHMWLCLHVCTHVCAAPVSQEHVYIYLLDGDTRLLCDDPPHELPPNGKLR